METKILQFAKTHLFYLIIIGIGLFAFRSWLGEHDGKLLAQQQVKVSEQRVQDLVANNQAIAAAAQQQKTVVIKEVAAVKTSQDAVAVIPKLTTVPLEPQVADGNKLLVDAIPLIQVLGQAKQDSIDLQACQVQRQNDQGIIAEKNKEITALKKPLGFWGSVKHDGKTFLFGFAVGFGLRQVK